MNKDTYYGRMRNFLSHHVHSADELWMHAIRQLMDNGISRSSRVGAMTEVLGFSCTLTEIESNFIYNTHRALDPTYAAAEFVWYMSGERSGDIIKAYAPSYVKFLDDDGSAYGAYGARWQEQLTHLIHLLTTASDTRQAVLTCWDWGMHADLYHAAGASKKDLPCTLALQFFVRDGCLHLITTMRSNDAWLGMPYDVFCFTTLQMVIASMIGLDTGTYTHQVGSLHVYEKDRARLYHAYLSPIGPPSFQLHVTREMRRCTSLDELKRLVNAERLARTEHLFSDAFFIQDDSEQDLLTAIYCLCARRWATDDSARAIVERGIPPSLLEAARTFEARKAKQ